MSKPEQMSLAKQLNEIHQTRQEGICIHCKQKPEFYSSLGRKEWGISGICEYCFDEVMMEPNDKCLVCEHPSTWHTNRWSKQITDHDFIPKHDEDSYFAGKDGPF